MSGERLSQRLQEQLEQQGSDPDCLMDLGVIEEAVIALELAERRAADAERVALQAKVDAIDALCDRHDITVKGIVALVDGMLDGTALTSLGWHDESCKPDDPMVAYWLGADRLLACARRLARGEDA